MRPEFFYREQNKWIYQSILELHDRREPVDLITLTEELRRREQLEELGGEAYVIGLINIVPTSINAKHYGRIVEATALRRRLIAAATQIATLAYTETDPNTGKVTQFPADFSFLPGLATQQSCTDQNAGPIFSPATMWATDGGASVADACTGLYEG